MFPKLNKFKGDVGDVALEKQISQVRSYDEETKLINTNCSVKLVDINENSRNIPAPEDYTLEKQLQAGLNLSEMSAPFINSRPDNGIADAEAEHILETLDID